MGKEIIERDKQGIFPEFDEIIQRRDKERFLNQHSRVIWLTGLSGSGKTTIGSALERKLFERKYLSQVLDGDNIRSGINNNLSFSVEDRNENIRRIAEVSKLMLNSGIIVINCFISPTNKIRQTAKEIIGEENYIEVFINAPLAVCEERDTKGLYEKARKGEIKDFTGIDSPFEAPLNPDIELRTDKLSVEESIDKVLDHILPYLKY
ncbi:MAG: adenylyl-sulfate kinase [Bacteroidales bacterium]|nr:adenylyl-sulfate kinase [Bacteroidales bacterium]